MERTNSRATRYRLTDKMVVGSFAAALVVVMYAAVSAHIRPYDRVAVAATHSMQDQPEEVTLTLKNGGFKPDKITRQAGRFQFTVDNRSRAEELVLRLDQEDGTRVREIRVTRNAVDWSEELDLSPGVYLLTEASHERWVCRFVIQ